MAICEPRLRGRDTALSGCKSLSPGSKRSALIWGLQYFSDGGCSSQAFEDMLHARLSLQGVSRELQERARL